MRLASVTAVVVCLLVSSRLDAQVITGNLLANPGAELGAGTDPGTVTGWTLGGTSTPGRDNGTFDGFGPHSGSFQFYGHTGVSGTLDQTVNLLTAGLTPAQLVGATANFSFFEASVTTDSATVNLTFLSAASLVLGTATSGEIDYDHSGTYTQVSNSAAIPLGTVSVDYQMSFIRHAGNDIDAFVDDNNLTVTTIVPEPSSWAMVLAGLGPLALLRRRSAPR